MTKKYLTLDPSDFIEIGTKFYNKDNVLLEVVNSTTDECEDCYYCKHYCYGRLCISTDRPDNTSIIFKEVKTKKSLKLFLLNLFNLNSKPT